MHASSRDCVHVAINTGTPRLRGGWADVRSLGGRRPGAPVRGARRVVAGLSAGDVVGGDHDVVVGRGVGLATGLRRQPVWHEVELVPALPEVAGRVVGGRTNEVPASVRKREAAGVVAASLREANS